MEGVSRGCVVTLNQGVDGLGELEIQWGQPLNVMGGQLDAQVGVTRGDVRVMVQLFG